MTVDNVFDLNEVEIVLELAEKNNKGKLLSELVFSLSQHSIKLYFINLIESFLKLSSIFPRKVDPSYFKSY